MIEHRLEVISLGSKALGSDRKGPLQPQQALLHLVPYLPSNMGLRHPARGSSVEPCADCGPRAAEPNGKIARRQAGAPRDRLQSLTELGRCHLPNASSSRRCMSAETGSGVCIPKLLPFGAGA